MQTPSATAPSPTFFLFPNPLIPSPPHLRQQYPSHCTALLSTGFCGIYSNILTFRLPSLPEQKWFVTAGDGLGRGASSNTLPTPPPPPVLLCRKADFSLLTPIFFFPPCSFIHRCSSCQLEKALKAPRGSFFFFFFVWLHSVMDKLGDIPLFVDILCLLSLFFVPFAQCPPSVWSCADTVYGSSEGNPATAFMWILWGYGATKWLLLLFFRGL